MTCSTFVTSRILVALGAVTLLLAGCGGSGTQSDGSADRVGADAAGGGTGGSAAGGTSGGGRGGGTAGTSGGTGGVGIGRRLEIQNFSVSGNCMPIVAPDPIMVSWTSVVNG